VSTQFTPIASLVGGMMIGLSASALLLFNGKIAGISGIYGGLLSPAKGDTLWRLFFVLGLLAGGVALAFMYPDALQMNLHRPGVVVAVAGLLVGFGARLGNGCTSGHGVCGISRRSPRSLVATMTFMATGILTTFVFNHLLRGTP